jgi:hypothetical protein
MSGMNVSRSAARFVILLLLTGCGGRMVNKKTARDILVNASPGGLDSRDVEVESVSQIGSRDAIVAAKVKVAFKLENVQGQWIVREVRAGDYPWERLDLIIAALDAAKAKVTQQTFEEISISLAAYSQKNGRLPEFKDFLALSDALYPNYLPNIVRLDAWNRPIAAERLAANTIRLSSAGPDGQSGSKDDIVLTRSYR